MKLALSNPSQVLFLDVETTGLSWFYDELTIVGWACDGAYSFYTAGDDPSPLLMALRSAETLVTFNGTLFDLKFLKKSFGDVQLPNLHVDLRYFAKRAGLSGGQKAIERNLGLPARSGFENSDGAEAVILWHKFLRGDQAALRRLVEYNRHDVFGMCRILDEVMDRLDRSPDLLFGNPKFSDAIDTGASTLQIGKKSPPAARAQAAHFASLFHETPAASATVVGIDLTGSESRPSGFCILKGSVAQTEMVSSDDDIIARVMLERPVLVSIDSPLSMPFGRVQVEDTDPGREQFGIMRLCERELKRRGINVYPSLLPSMQGLTRRGMKLASRLRAAGIPVIESYPGAAQDIMRIPRKGAGQEFLMEGLKEFGITGRFLVDEVTHDELDAITSALVGHFFLAGRFEALSGPGEGALIVPDLMREKPNRMVVGLSGRISSGKTTTARFLEEQGFAYTRFSMVIDDEIVRRGLLLNRANRQAVGAELHETKGQRWLCEKVLERVADCEHIVVDGLRFPEDYAFFVEQFGSQFIHLHLMASSEIRAARYKHGEADEVPFEIADSQPVEMQVDSLAGLASETVSNEGSVAELQKRISSLILAVRGPIGCQYQL